MTIFTMLAALVAFLFLSACDDDRRRGPVYTLYQSATEGERRHIATFDAAEPADYNENNCETARRLFASQENAGVQYWCERGRFEPQLWER
jgi:hypothetical protein